MQVNLDWKAIATIVAAVIGLIGGGALSAYRFKENWSPATRYRELRLLRSRESKAKEMNSASCDRVKDAFASSIKHDDCKLEQYRFVRELKNPRTNLKLGEESASLPDASMFMFASAWLLIVLFLDGLLALSGQLRYGRLAFFALAVLILFCLLVVVWAFLTRFIKSYAWNAITKKGFDDFLKPVFQEPRVSYGTQAEFKKAIRSVHNVYDNSIILSLGKACSCLLVLESILLVLVSIVDTVMSHCSRLNTSSSWFRLISLGIMTLVGVALLCCYFTYFSELQKLIRKEKELHP